MFNHRILTTRNATLKSRNRAFAAYSVRSNTYFGSLYEKAGQYDKATGEYETAYQMMQASKDDWHALNSLIALAGIYHATGNGTKELEYLDRTKQVAEGIKGIAAGADAYLSKPFNADELRTRVEKLLESRRLLCEKYAQVAMDSKRDDGDDGSLCRNTRLSPKRYQKNPYLEHFLPKVSEKVTFKVKGKKVKR